MNAVTKLPPFDPKSGELNVIIETPRGCRNKYSYDEKRRLFKLGSVLPAGAVFPFDFGFIPRTVGEDGDPLDVLVLMDEPAFSGCFVAARLLGVIEAMQTEDGETGRNDRLIAVSANAETHRDVKSLDDLNKKLVDQIEHFFVSYSEAINPACSTEKEAPVKTGGAVAMKWQWHDPQERFTFIICGVILVIAIW